MSSIIFAKHDYTLAIVISSTLASAAVLTFIIVAIIVMRRSRIQKSALDVQTANDVYFSPAPLTSLESN